MRALQTILILLCMGRFTQAASLYLPRQFDPAEMETVGIALVNPTSGAAFVTFQLKSALGEALATSQMIIPPKGQLSRTMRDIFPVASASGWLSVETDVDAISGLWLAGDFANSVDGAPLLRSTDATAYPGFTYLMRASEISFANLGSTPVTGDLRLLSAGGTIAASVPFEVPQAGLYQRTVASLFPALADALDSSDYWININSASDTAKIVGTSLTRTPGADQIAANAASILSNRFVFPHVIAGQVGGANYESRLTLTNFQSTPQTVTLILRPNSGSMMTVQRTIPAAGILRSTLTSLFGTSKVDGWLQVESSGQISGLLTYTDSGGGSTAVEKQSGNGDTEMVFGHLADLDPWSTGIALSNPSTTDAKAEVYAVDSSGNLIGGPSQSTAASFTVPALSKRAFQLSELVPLSQRRTRDGGYIYVRTTNGVGLHGTELFFLRNGRVYANVAATRLDGLTFDPPSTIVSTSHLNLGFETTVRDGLYAWGVGSTSFQYTADPGETHSGQRSLRIRTISAPAAELGVVVQSFPIELVRGKRVRISHWMKTENVDNGVAGLWWRVDGTAGTLSIDNSPPPNLPAPGTTGWTRYSFERDVSPDLRSISWGFFQRGGGTAWFDDVQIEIDGVPLADKAGSPVGEPTTEQIQWIRDMAIPFNGDDPRQGYADLMPLKDVIGNARIVGLGEATHGTREFFRMKHRLVEFLATEMGFTIFSIEANMPEAYRLNNYVLRGEGDPKALLKGMYFWTWNTQEVLDMILWMREFNLSGRGRIEFTGFDMQTATVAMQIVRDFITSNERGELNTVDAAISLGTTATSSANNGNTALAAAAAAAWKPIVDRLEFYRGWYVDVGVSAQNVDWAIQNARVTLQAMQMRSNEVSRDRSMAANVEWIAKQSPNAKIVLWAHNFHISRGLNAQGSFLAERFGTDYLPIEFAFNEGSYNAIGTAGLRAYPANVSFPGSAEYIFHNAGLPPFILDIRKASPYEDASSWILEDIYFRHIGSVPVDGFNRRTNLTTFSDILIYFEHSTPSVLLPF